MGNLVVLLFICLITALVGGLTWPYSIEQWAAYLGNDVDVHFWQGAILGFIPGVGQISIPFAVITWILMLILT